jgi:hypothetical protein
MASPPHFGMGQEWTFLLFGTSIAFTLTARLLRMGTRAMVINIARRRVER